LIENYDKDKDGKLSVEEIKTMRRPPKNADVDQDGFVTKEELVDSLSGSSSSKPEGAATTKTQSRASTTFRASSGASRSGSRSSSTLSGLDANQNNQVEMHEFSSEWDEKKLAEFYEKDKNGDGVITLREWSGK
jgi:Ca2+-binding EF-hand superfamily protein